MEEKERLKKQLDFILEVDKVKNIFRQTYLADGNRKENDAEHSWHLALMAGARNVPHHFLSCFRLQDMSDGKYF